MSTLVPDTLQGALILSIIDFFLSFVIISGIGFVLAAFPVLNHTAKLFAKAPAKDAHGTHGAHAAKPAPRAAAAKPAAVPPNDVAASAAAVFAVMDGKPYRIINIEPSVGRSAWVAEGRFAHHGSHTPR